MIYDSDIMIYDSVGKFPNTTLHRLIRIRFNYDKHKTTQFILKTILMLTVSFMIIIGRLCYPMEPANFCIFMQDLIYCREGILNPPTIHGRPLKDKDHLF